MSFWDDHPDRGPGAGKCQEITRVGKPCQAPAVGGYSQCNFHMGGRASEAGTKGNRSLNRHLSTAIKMIKGDGSADLPPLNFQTPADVLDSIQEAANRVLRNELRSDQAQMVAYLGAVALQAFKAANAVRAGDDKPMPEITEIERSSDHRAVDAEFPGSEEGSQGRSN